MLMVTAGIMLLIVKSLILIDELCIFIVEFLKLDIIYTIKRENHLNR